MNFLFNIIDISKIKRISFRHDINGLRAIAVLSVVFYHADISIFKGGWLGVDIFFVISGYLISNIIISELNEKIFSFKNFYIRRIKRILPGLLSTLLLTIPFAYFFLPPKAMEEYIRSLIASIFFYANIHFKGLDFYIAESTKVMPLLHTWSLAIEEQYYLLFPLISFFIFKYFKKYFTFFIASIAFISIYLNTSTNELEKFYGLEFRIWELLLGVLVMILSSNIQIKHLEKLGFPLMLIPIFYFDDSWINDIEPKLISLIGLALIIFSNTSYSVLTKFLSIKLFSVIGLSSYSIYLLHQPLFAFVRIYIENNKNISFYADSFNLNSPFLIFLIVILLFLGNLHYKYIEIKISKSNKLFLFISSSLFALLLFSFVGNTNNFYSDRFGNERLVSEAIRYQNLENFDLKIGDLTCHVLSRDIEVRKLCTNTPNNSSKEIIVLGDSHSRTFLKPFNEKFINHSITYATGSSCIFLVNKLNTSCVRSDQEKIINKLKSTENSIIIYFADLQDKINNEEDNFKINVPQTINELASNNVVILIKQVPLFPVNVGDRILSSPWVNEVSYPKEEWLINQNRLEVEEMYKTIRNKNVFFVDTFEIFCSEIKKDYCVGAYKDQVYIYDDNHPSAKGSKLIISKIELILNNLNY